MWPVQRGAQHRGNRHPPGTGEATLAGALWVRVSQYSGAAHTRSAQPSRDTQAQRGDKSCLREAGSGPSLEADPWKEAQEEVVVPCHFPPLSHSVSLPAPVTVLPQAQIPLVLPSEALRAGLHRLSLDTLSPVLSSSIAPDGGLSPCHPAQIPTFPSDGPPAPCVGVPGMESGLRRGDWLRDGGAGWRTNIPYPEVSRRQAGRSWEPELGAGVGSHHTRQPAAKQSPGVRHPTAAAASPSSGDLAGLLVPSAVSPD